MIPVVITSGSDITQTGSTLQGNPNSDAESTDGEVSSLVQIAGPVARIEIDYNNAGTATQEILVSDLLLTTIDATPNDDPIAVDDAFATDVDTAAAFNITGNDSDPDTDPITLTSIGGGLGTVTFNAAGDVSYTPPAGFVGTDTFTYTISDGNGGTDIGEFTVDVTLAVNVAPVAVDDTATTQVDTLVSNIDVIGNDTDADVGDVLTLVPGSAVSGDGTVTENPDGTLNFDPAPGFLGSATVTYTVTDGVESDTGTLTIDVTPDVNDPPVAVDDAASTPFDTLVSNIDVIGNDTDADPADVLSLVPGSATSANGTVTENPDGSLNFTPTPGFTGPANVTYTVTDGTLTDTGTLTVTVGPAPNTPRLSR